MKIICYISLCLLLHFKVYAQKEDHIWLFGDETYDVKNPELKADTTRGASEINFFYDPFKMYYVEPRVIDVAAANASISDTTGRLLAYSNGQVLYSGNEHPIADTINYHWYSSPDSTKYCSEWNANNFGNAISAIPAGILGIQRLLILPMDTSFYTIFNTYDYCSKDIFKVSFNRFGFPLSRPEGVLFEKDSSILQGKFSLNIYAVRHGNGRDWWIIQLDENNISYHQFLLSESGIENIGVMELPSNAFPRGNGQVVISPDGKKFAFATIGGSIQNVNGHVVLFEFDRCTGEAEFVDEKIFPKINSFGPGVIFSSDSRFLYMSEGFKIFQYDTYVENVFLTETIIAEYDGFFYQPTPNDLEYDANFHFMGLAPDGRIYITPSSTTNRHLGVINFPNQKGLDCDMRQHPIELPTKFFRTMPNFPHFRLGPDDGSPCDTLGLDNHPVAKFRYEPDSSDYKKIRFTDLSYFRPETWRWDFGDGSPTVSERYPFHTYAQNGTYEVCLTVINENSSHTTCRTVTIGTSSSEDAGIIADITLFPNPVSDVLLVTLGEYIPESGYIHILDSTGKKVLSQRLYYGHNHIDMSFIAQGLYFWTAEDLGVQLNAGKVVKI
ncbi:MAG: PKD domain-containing protein [Saprospiraceae bacterium]